VKDFIWTMVYTGLRISDVALFQMKRLRGNEVFLRAKKNGDDVFAYLPDSLRDRLIARAEKRGPRPFVVGQSDRLATVRRRKSFRKDRFRHLLATWTELLMTRQETNTGIPTEDRVVISLSSELFSLPE
jgi:integrase